MITLNIDNKKKLDFTEKLIKIGRNSRVSEEIEIIKDKNSEGVNLFLKNKKALSREHCEIFEKDFQWYIKDLQSANGTYLNNRRIESLENYPLRDGDSLLLSKDVSIIVSLKDKEETVIDIGQENEDATLINNVFIDIKEITDDIITRKVTNKIYYLETINNKYKSYAFILDFSQTKEIDLVNLLGLNQILGEIIFIFHNGYISLDNKSDAQVNINNISIKQNQIIYNGNIIDINNNRFVFVEHTNMEIINNKIKNEINNKINNINDGRGRTEIIDRLRRENEPTLELSSYTTLNNGQYIILERLGEVGGFGITYLAEDNKLNSKVAIKEYFPRIYAKRDEHGTVLPISTNRENFKWGYEAFKKEAQTIANIPRHNNIVNVKNLFEENGTVYYVMEYTNGEDLESYLKRKRPLSQIEIENIIFPFLDGIKHIHQYNILHRDIKLSNILITKSGTPILIDFGTARNQTLQRAKKLTTVYTEGYAPLEQLTGEKEGTYTDIYSIGMVIYAMMNGIINSDELPSAIKRLDMKHSRGKSCLTFPKRFSKSFVQAVEKSLEIQYKDRPQTVDKFIHLLKKKEPKLVNIYIFVTLIIISVAIGVTLML